MNTIWTEAEEAERLAARFKSVHNRSEFARQHAIPGGPAMIHQHTSAKRPIGLDAAMVYARAFGCTLEEISPRLAMKAVEAAKLVGSAAEFENARTQAPQVDRRALNDTIDGILGLFGMSFEDYAHQRSKISGKSHSEKRYRQYIVPSDGDIDGQKEG